MASALKSLPFVRAGTVLLTTQATQTCRRKAFQPNVIRNYASGGAGGKEGGSRLGLWATLAAVGAGGGYYIWSTQDTGSKGGRKQEDYQKVVYYTFLIVYFDNLMSLFDTSGVQCYCTNFRGKSTV